MQALLVLLLLASPARATLAVGDGPPHWRALREQSNQALLANDCQSARRLLLQLQPLMPGNPRNIYNLAACNARLLRVSADLRHQQVLEQQWPGLGEATHGAIVADCFNFLANTGRDSYDQRGIRRAPAAPVSSSVWVMPLTARADCHRDFHGAMH